MDANRKGWLQSRGFSFLYDVGDANLAMVALRVNAEVPFVIDREIITAPAFKAVVIFSVFECPRR